MEITKDLLADQVRKDSNEFDKKDFNLREALINEFFGSWPSESLAVFAREIQAARAKAEK